MPVFHSKVRLFGMGWRASRGRRDEDFSGGLFSMRPELLAREVVVTMTLMGNLDDRPHFGGSCVRFVWVARLAGCALEAVVFHDG
jgi:hypothetical protein